MDVKIKFLSQRVLGVSGEVPLTGRRADIADLSPALSNDEWQYSLTSFEHKKLKPGILNVAQSVQETSGGDDIYLGVPQ